MKSSKAQSPSMRSPVANVIARSLGLLYKNSHIPVTIAALNEFGKRPRKSIFSACNIGSRSKYMPHNGVKEMARRVAQMESTR